MAYSVAQAAVFVARTGSSSILIWSCVLVVMLIGAFVVVGQVKKRLRDDLDQNPTASSGFTLSDLRQLHRTGQISDEEFERAKGRLVAAARKATQPNAPPAPDENDGERQ